MIILLISIELLVYKKKKVILWGKVNSNQNDEVGDLNTYPFDRIKHILLNAF